MLDTSGSQSIANLPALPALLSVSVGYKEEPFREPCSMPQTDCAVGSQHSRVTLEAHGPFVSLYDQSQRLKRFEFESQLLRSGVLAVDSAGPSDEAVIFIRGAPSCIEQLLGNNQVPNDYHQVCSTLPIATKGASPLTATVGGV